MQHERTVVNFKYRNNLFSDALALQKFSANRHTTITFGQCYQIAASTSTFDLGRMYKCIWTHPTVKSYVIFILIVIKKICNLF